MSSLAARLPGATGAATREVGQGELFVTDKPNLALTATLGSCVAICLRDDQGRAGGMNHIFQAVLPGPMGGANVIADIERLVNQLMGLGVSRSHMVARLAGGAQVLGRGPGPGKAIALTCLDYLNAEKINVVQTDLGGKRPRRISFDPLTGQLQINYPGSVPADVAMEPRATSTGNSCELF